MHALPPAIRDHRDVVGAAETVSKRIIGQIIINEIICQVNNLLVNEVYYYSFIN
jgi:hypothetical protein